MVKWAALILAGGKARRFQGKDKGWHDKALAQLGGKPLLVHAIKNVEGVVDQVFVCVNDEARKAIYTQTLNAHELGRVKVVVDEKVDHISGPNVAIMSGLKAAEADYCLTLPCDMPFLKAHVAEYLLSEAEGFDVAVPMWPNGRLETLLMVLQRQTALEIAEALCLLKRPRSDDIPRGANKTLLVSPLKKIKSLDPELKSFININSKEDLTRLQTRRAHGPVTENLKLNLGEFSISDLQLLHEGAKILNEGKFSQAQSTFATCASNFESADSYFWSGLAGETHGEALLKLSQQQTEPKAAMELDFEGKEAFLKASNCYRVEAEMYDEKLCRVLAERAWADKAWCESWAMGKTCHAHRSARNQLKI
jgi:molybdopterin-guanine dinucleotide biosynthesis protein A